MYMVLGPALTEAAGRPAILVSCFVCVCLCVEFSPSGALQYKFSSILS